MPGEPSPETCGPETQGQSPVCAQVLLIAQLALGHWLRRQKFQESRFLLPLGILLILLPSLPTLSTNHQAPLPFGGQVASCLWDIYILQGQPHWGQVGLS